MPEVRMGFGVWAWEYKIIKGTHELVLELSRC